MSEEVKKIRDNMKCAHCGCTFQGTDSQAFHFKYEGREAYCSQICRHAAQRAKLCKPLPQHGPCPTCGKMFESRTSKVFCSLECYNKSPEFKEMARANCKKGKQTQEEMWAEKMQRICPVCGKEFRADRSHRKFCSHLCYRKFRADLFDAWVANPQQIALPQCYDEFMLQEELPCLIEGCNWKGRHLSVHLNQAHGVLAADFKRAAGFNLKTGLVAPDLAEELSQRRKLGVAVNPVLQQKGQENRYSGVRNYQSLEGKEHRRKARMMIDSEGPERTCIGCGAKFRQSTPFGKALYCTIPCRTDHYAKMNHSKAKKRVRQGNGTFKWEST